MEEISSILLWLGRFRFGARWFSRRTDSIARRGAEREPDDRAHAARHLDRFIARSPASCGTLIVASLAASIIAADGGASPIFATLWTLVICVAASGVLYARMYPTSWRQKLIGLTDSQARLYSGIAATGIGLFWSAGILVFGAISGQNALALAPLSGVVGAMGCLALVAMPVPSRMILTMVIVPHALDLLALGSLPEIGAAIALAVLCAGLWHFGSIFAPLAAAAAKAQDRASHLQAAIERVRLGAIVVDSDRRIVVANSAAAAILRIDIALLSPGSDFSFLEPHLPGFRLDGNSADSGSGISADPRRPNEFRTPQGRRIEIRETPRADGVHVIILEDVTTRRKRDIEQQRQVVALDSILRGEAFEETATVLASSIWDENPNLCFGVLFLSQAASRLQLIVSVGLPEDLKRTYRDFELRTAPALIRDAVERHIEGTVPDLTVDANFSIVEKAELKRGGFQACWIRPILSNANEALGAIIGFRPTKGGPEQEESDLAKALARSIASAHGRHVMLRQRMEREEIELAQGAKRRFLANMSHELRTPLNAISGFADAMRSQIFGPLGHKNYSDYAGDIHASGTKLLEIIDSILEFARIESDSYVLEEKAVDLLQLVAGYAEAARKSADPTRIEIDCSAASLPLLRADEHAVGEAIRHLIANAVRFAPAGSTISIMTGISEKKEIWIQIKDRGIGIAPELVGRVLRPFSMLANPLARGQGKGGVGLGLPLAKAYVELHGGRFVLDSALGQGTQATIMFPAVRTLAEETAGRALLLV